MAAKQATIAPWSAEKLAQLKTMRFAGAQMAALMVEFPERSRAAIERALVKMIRNGEIERRGQFVSKTQRPCLGGCGQMRDSDGFGDRICKRCKNTETWRSGLYADMPLSGVLIRDR